MDIPQATNLADRAISGFIIDVATPAVEAALIAECPWLKLPIISTIFDFFMKRAASKYADQMSKAANDQIIDFKVNKERTEYQGAVSALQSAVAQGDANAVSEATAEFNHSVDDLLNLHR